MLPCDKPYVLRSVFVWGEGEGNVSANGEEAGVLLWYGGGLLYGDVEPFPSLGPCQAVRAMSKRYSNRSVIASGRNASAGATTCEVSPPRT